MARLKALALSAHLLVRGLLMLKFAMLKLGLTTLLLAGFAATAAGAAASTHRHHHRSPAHTVAHRAARGHARSHVQAAASHGRRGHRHLSRAGRRRAALEPRQQPRHAEVAAIPLERFRMLPPLRGSHESLVRQNDRADRDGLKRVADDEALLALLEAKDLVPLPVGAGLRADERLPGNRRYCRSWTANFLDDLARLHYGRFHSPLQVNSAVRTVEYQRRLLHMNGNAAPAEGDVASPHLTGATIDIGKKGLSPMEVGWMRAYLTPLQSAGKLDVEEEFQQSCFHITVYKSYAPIEGLDPVPPSVAAAPLRHRHRRVLSARASAASALGRRRGTRAAETRAGD